MQAFFVPSGEQCAWCDKVWCGLAGEGKVGQIGNSPPLPLTRVLTDLRLEGVRVSIQALLDRPEMWRVWRPGNHTALPLALLLVGEVIEAAIAVTVMAEFAWEV